LLVKIKGLTVTLWAAISGWAVSQSANELLYVSMATIFGLWFVAATFRGAQKRYIACSAKFYAFLSSSDALVALDSSGTLPDDVPRGLGGNETFWGKSKLVVLGLVSPTVALFYGFFAAI